MPDLDGIAWREERQADIDAGLDWLEELSEETERLLAEDARRYGPWPSQQEEKAA